MAKPTQYSDWRTPSRILPQIQHSISVNPNASARVEPLATANHTKRKYVIAIYNKDTLAGYY